MIGPAGATHRRRAHPGASTTGPAAPAGAVATGPGAVRTKADRRNRTARCWAFGLLLALLAQFGIGMYVNLFTHIPLHHPGHRAHNYLTGTFHSLAWAETSQHAPFILATHAGLGLLLVAGSLWLAARAARGTRPAVTWAAVLGALCILGAALNGASFLDYNNNLNSYLMALLFAAAVLCYSVILALAPGDNEQPALLWQHRHHSA